MARGDVRLSIQVVTWNSAAVLDACLESVVAQTCTDCELIVLDNRNWRRSLGSRLLSRHRAPARSGNGST